jgi:hypothetical protein
MAIENFTVAFINPVFVQNIWFPVVIQNIQLIDVANFYTTKECSAALENISLTSQCWGILNCGSFRLKIYL